MIVDWLIALGADRGGVPVRAVAVDSAPRWPVPAAWVLGAVLAGMLLNLASALYAPSGSIVQAALTSVFMAYILFSAAPTTNLILQCAVVLAVLISIPPSMPSSASRTQWLAMAVLVLLLTHALQMGVDARSLSLNLFWYRMAELALCCALFWYAMYCD